MIWSLTISECLLQSLLSLTLEIVTSWLRWYWWLSHRALWCEFLLSFNLEFKFIIVIILVRSIVCRTFSCTCHIERLISILIELFLNSFWVCTSKHRVIRKRWLISYINWFYRGAIFNLFGFLLIYPTATDCFLCFKNLEIVQYKLNFMIFSVWETETVDLAEFFWRNHSERLEDLGDSLVMYEFFFEMSNKVLIWKFLCLSFLEEFTQIWVALCDKAHYFILILSKIFCIFMSFLFLSPPYFVHHAMIICPNNLLLIVLRQNISFDGFTPTLKMLLIHIKRQAFFVLICWGGHF